METLIFTDVELQLGTERSRKYQGTAKIDLDHIRFHPHLSRAIEPKNTERLCGIFRKEGCRRFDIQNHVTAVVSRECLQSALHAARKTPEELLTTAPEKFLHLPFSADQVLCLHGQHRIRAGAEVLPEGDRWWTVDLYLDDISPELRTALIEEYTNELRPSDGEIYRKIRQYQQEHNARFQKRWWARLSQNKAKRLRQLSKNIDLSTAFDALLPIPGMWSGMSIGKLAKVMALDCDEEIVNYLTFHVRKFWESLVSADPENPDVTSLLKIDRHTVETLQLMAPGVSRADARAVQGWVLSGEVLGAFSESERSRMWKRLQQFDGLIPSLHTFFRDVDYLQPCAHAVKRLFGLSKNCPSVRKAMWYHYAPTQSMEDGCLIQTTESRFERRPGSRAEHLELAYRQVWLYAMRYYPNMAKDPESDDLLAKPTNEKADESVVYDMAVLAQRLGFKSPAIQEIINRSPDRQIAQKCLLKARKPDRYEYPVEIFETLVSRIAECFSKATPREHPLPSDALVNFSATLKARCGLPSTQTQKQDRRFLFVDYLHTREVVPMETVSTLFVRRCVYFAFFGWPFTHSTSHTVDSISNISDEVNIPISPLFFTDVAAPWSRAAEQTSTQTEEAGPTEAAKQARLRREADEQAAEQARLKREADEQAAEQARLKREADERAAEQAQLKREAEERAAEQARLMKEAEERAAEAAEQARAEQARLRREAEERAAEQARLRREADEQAAEAAEQARAEQARLRREAEERAAEHARLMKEAEEPAAEQARLRRETDAESGAPRPVTQLDFSSLITRSQEALNPQNNESAIISETSELPPQSSNVKNQWRAEEETEYKFTQTCDAEADVLPEESLSPEEETVPSEQSHAPVGSQAGPSNVAEQERLSEAYLTASEQTTEQSSQVTTARGKTKNSKKRAAPYDESTVEPQVTATPAPSARPLTQFQFQISDKYQSGVRREHEATLLSRPEQPSSREQPDAMIFMVWQGGRWRQKERVIMLGEDDLRIDRMIKRYEQIEHAEFLDSKLRTVTAAQCLSAARADGADVIFMRIDEGPLKRTVTRAMVTAANKILEQRIAHRRKRAQS